MSTSIISYQNNDEISAIMRKKFASKFKVDSNNAIDTKFELAMNENKENELEYKINKLSFIFPSVNKNIIEHVFNNNNDLKIEQGIELIKREILKENKNDEINNNKPRRRPKRNYNSLILSQLPKKPMNNLPFNNYSQNLNEINNNKIIDNSRTNIFENSEKLKEKERNKLELKTVDKVVEEITNIKNNKDLRNYLFIQLSMLEAHKEREIKKQKITNIFNHLEQDNIDLKKCTTTIIRPINKKSSELNKKEAIINETNDKIDKVQKSIIYYENLGNLYYDIQQIKKMNI
jgi:hypothetical protein